MIPTHAQIAERCAEVLALDEKRFTKGTMSVRQSGYGPSEMVADSGADDLRVTFIYSANAQFFAAAPCMAQCIRELLEALREAESRAEKVCIQSLVLRECFDKMYKIIHTDDLTEHYKVDQLAETLDRAKYHRDQIDAILNPEAKT